MIWGSGCSSEVKGTTRQLPNGASASAALFSYRQALATHLALYASLVDKLIDEVGRDAGLGCGSSKVKDFAC